MRQQKLNVLRRLDRLVRGWSAPDVARPSGGLTIDFVVVPDRAQLSELVQIDIYSERTTDPRRGGKRIWIFAGVKSFPNILGITP
jgi:hypothetical protein